MTRVALATGVIAAVLVLPGPALAAPISVTTAADVIDDNGACSLREAISAANGDNDGPGDDCAVGSGTDVISVPASGNDYALQIPRAGDPDDNASGDLDITSNLTISGAGTSATVIEGSDLDRVLHVIGSVTVQIRDVTVAGGQAPSGVDGPPASNGTPMGGEDSEGGDGTDGEDGGGILNAGGTLNLTRVSVQDNRAGDGGDGGDGASAGGGPTGAAGGASLGGTGGTAGNGGGVANNAGDLTIVDSTFSQNFAGDGGAAGHGGNGGDGGSNPAGPGGNGGSSTGGNAGTGGSGGALSIAFGSLSITRTVISENSAGLRGTTGNGGTAGDGGAGNGGTGGTGGDSLGGGGFFGGSGGGIFQEGPTLLELTDSTVRDNNAGDGTTGGAGGLGGNGGSGSPAGAGGDSHGGDGGNAAPYGGILSGTGEVQISHSTISGNEGGDGGAGGAGLSGGTSPGLDGDSFGGAGGTAGFTGGMGAFSVSGSLVNVTIAGNRAGAGGAGGVGGAGPQTSTGGNGGPGGGRGGLDAGGSSSFPLTHVTIASNETGPGGAGGDGGTGDATFAGTAAAAGTVGGFFSSATIPVRNTLIANNSGNECGGSGFLDQNNNLSFPDAPMTTCTAATLHGNPLLGALANNGGPTFTMKLGAGSAAVDQVPLTLANCQPTDQRQVTRPKGTMCDVGAFELSAPSATTGASSAVTSTGAKLAGTVNPGQVPTTYRFQFGKTTAYGSQTSTGSAGSGASSVAAAGTLTGLAPQTTYHYRLVATSSDGTATGADRTFTTGRNVVATPPPGSSSFQGLRTLTNSARLSGRGVASIRVLCPAASLTSCRGTLSFTARVRVKVKSKKATSSQTKRKTLKLGKANVSLRPGQTRTIRIKITRAGRRILRRSKRLRTTLTAAARDGTGGKAKTTTRRVTLRVAKRKR